MIAKINHGESLYGIVSYNRQKVDQGKADVIHTHRIILARDDNPESLFSKTLQSFEPYLAANPRVKKPVVHISINPDREDRVDSYKLARIADDYLQQMGYGDQPYIVYRHTDIERTHIHIVTVNIDGNGERISDRYEKLRSMDISRALEKKYGLKQLTAERDEESRLYLKKVDYTKGDVKRQISGTVKTVPEMYGFQTLGEYNALLSVFNIHVKHVRGEEEGNLYNGIVYCALDDKGELVGNPIKSSRIGKDTGYDALRKKMKKTTEKVKSGKIAISGSKSVIRDAMRRGGGKERFEEILKQQGIGVVFRENEERRIYGVTFIDHNLRLAYNGSRLGKEFSANAFHSLFERNTATEIENRDMERNPSDAGITASAPSHPVTSVDEIFGTFYLDSTGYDPQEEDFIRKLRRKKKKDTRRKIS